MATCSSTQAQADLPSRTSELLRHLWELPDRSLGIPIADLPASLRSEELLIICYSEGLIEFGWANTWGSPGKKALCWHQKGFDYDRPDSSYFKQAFAYSGTPDYQPRVKLSGEGELAACRIRNGIELTASVGNTSDPKNEATVPAAMSIANCDDVAKAIAAEIERSPKTNAKAKTKSVSVDEAHSLLVKLVKDSPAYNEFTREQLATLVAGKTGKNCSPATISNTHYWKTNRRHERGKKGACHPTAVGKSMLEDVATKDNVVRGRGYEPTGNEATSTTVVRGCGYEPTIDEARRRIKKSKLDGKEKEGLLAQLHGGQTDPAEAIRIVDVMESS